MVAEKPKKLVVDLEQGQLHRQFRTRRADRSECKTSAAYGGKFALSGLQQNVRPIFEIARLDQVFRIFPDTASAFGA